jgi:hypothetical protein
VASPRPPERYRFGPFGLRLEVHQHRLVHQGVKAANILVNPDRALVAHHEQLRVWDGRCPENFENRTALVDAEIAQSKCTLDAVECPVFGATAIEG